MTELQELLKQRNEIVRRINAIQAGEVTCGRAKLSMDKFNARGSWRVIVLVDPLYDRNGHNITHASVIRAWERNEVIEDLPNLIKDLTDLYNAVKDTVDYTEESDNA